MGPKQAGLGLTEKRPEAGAPKVWKVDRVAWRTSMACPTRTLSLTPQPVSVPVYQEARDKLRLQQRKPFPGGGLGVSVPTAYPNCNPDGAADAVPQWELVR